MPPTLDHPSAASPVGMDRATFEALRELIYTESGIRLRDGKEAMLAARIGRRVRALNLASHQEYLAYVRQHHAADEIVHLLDTVSTNVTSFFREPHHFEVLGAAVARWMGEGQTRLRFWSAGCSTGPEPYSLAITVLEAARGQDVDARILATDLSTRVLAQAQVGAYAEADVRPVPPSLRDKYFEWNRTAGVFQVRPVLRERIVFRRLNLVEQPFPMAGPLDAVFCRNVMIYFDQRLRHNLIAEVHRLLRRGGYFMLGHAESLTADGGAGFARAAASCYTKR